MVTLSDQLQGGFNPLTRPERERLVPMNPGSASIARRRAVPAPEAPKPLDDCRAQAEVSVPAALDQSKPARAASEAVGLGLVASLVVGAGAVWAWSIVQLLLMISQAEPLLVQNILWTHQ
jgi:hypothetical protein